MFCSRCGSQNDDDARFCKVCGAGFMSRTARAPRADAPNGGERMSFEDALYQSLVAEGVRLLRNPRRLTGLVADMCDHTSSEFKVFEYNCNAELLDPFAEALEGERNVASLDAATNRAIFVLNDRSIEMQSAASTVLCIRNAVARVVGLPVLTPPKEAPQVETTRTDRGARANAESGVGQSPRSDETYQRASRASEEDRMPSGDSVYSKAPQGNATQRSQAQPQPQPQPQPVASPVPQQPANPPKQSSSTGLVVIFIILALVGALYFSTALGRGSSPTSSKSSAQQFDTSNGSGNTYDDSQDDDYEYGSEPVDSGDEPVDDPRGGSGANQGIADNFPRMWSGSYDGDDNGRLIKRQLLFEFYDVSESGEISGASYTGVLDEGPGATYGSYNVEGTIDWNTGDIHLWQTSWIDQGGLGPEREFKGRVDLGSWTMSGYLGTKDSGVFDVAWRVSATGSLDWNTNA